MAKVCLQCGDEGSEKDLVYCTDCTKFPIHRYCMNVMPDENDKNVRWICDDCFDYEQENDDDDDHEEEEEEEVSSCYQPLHNFNFKRQRQCESTPESTENITMIKKQRKDDLTADAQGNKLFAYSLFGHDDVAEPLIRSVWSGSFDICSIVDDSIYPPMEGFSAYLSAKSCPKVHREALHLRPGLELEMVPKFSVWPKGFVESGPTDDDIGLYFFPSLMKFEEAYDYLVLEMIRDDMALKGFVENGAELMIFTSFELPPRFQRFQGRLYLWGVFKGKNIMC